MEHRITEQASVLRRPAADVGTTSSRVSIAGTPACTASRAANHSRHGTTRRTHRQTHATQRCPDILHRRRDERPAGRHRRFGATSDPTACRSVVIRAADRRRQRGALTGRGTCEDDTEGAWRDMAYRPGRRYADRHCIRERRPYVIGGLRRSASSRAADGIGHLQPALRP